MQGRGHHLKASGKESDRKRHGEGPSRNTCNRVECGITWEDMETAIADRASWRTFAARCPTLAGGPKSKSKNVYCFAEAFL